MPNPRTAFLDTQVFEQEFYDFRSNRLSHLKQLVTDGLAKVVITEITRREVLTRIRETTVKAIQALKLIRKKRRAIGLLRHLSPMFDSIFAKHDPNEISAQLEEQFSQFCKELQIEELPLSLAANALASVVDDYFELRPPFRDGRKRHEFPDAIAGNILRNWNKDEKRDLFVVTDDKDWEGLCGKDHLTYVDSLTAFLAMFPDPVLAALLVAGLRGPNHEQVKKKIEYDFAHLDFFLRGAVGDIHEIEEVEAKFKDIVIVQVRKDCAIAEINCEVRYLASITYEVEGTGMWDPEDEVMLFVDTDSDQVTAFANVTVEVEFEFDLADPTKLLYMEDVAFSDDYIELDYSQSQF